MFGFISEFDNVLQGGGGVACPVLTSLHFYPFISQYVSLLTNVCLQILQNIL